MRTLKVIFTSDTHGYLYPTDYTDRTEKSMGLMKLMTAFDKDENTLLLDGGDTIQGSPFTNYTGRLEITPHPCAQVLNLAGYDFVTLGNHDFNQGLGHLKRYLDSLNARCLCANITDKAKKLPIAPYAVKVMKNGLRVGLVGVCTHHILRWEKAETLEMLDVREPVPAAREALAALKGKTDVNICLYHGGFERDLKTGEKLTESTENQACEICGLGFDLVLCGHQHMAVEGVRFGSAWAVQPAWKAANFCRVELTENENGWNIASALAQPGKTADARAWAALMPLEKETQRWLDQPKGHLDVALSAGEHLENAVNGSLIANFVNQVQLEASGADISACSLANEIKGLEKNVTVRDVVSTYVYSNTLYVLRLTGAELKQYMERCAEYFTLREGKLEISRAFLQPKVEHYNYDYFSGAEYVFDITRPLGDRVTSIRVRGRELSAEDTVTVCVNSYRASGTGGYDVLCGRPVVRDIQRDVAEMMIGYIEDHPDILVDGKKYLTVIPS